MQFIFCFKSPFIISRVMTKINLSLCTTYHRAFFHTNICFLLFAVIVRTSRLDKKVWNSEKLRHLLKVSNWLAFSNGTLPTIQETQVWFLGWEDPLEKEIAAHSSILAWKIPWTEELGRLQSMGLQESDTTFARGRHDLMTKPPVIWTRVNSSQFLALVLPPSVKNSKTAKLTFH